MSGLVDSTSESEFDDALHALKDTWDQRETDARETNNPQFHDWFLLYHALDMKSKMLLPLRLALGLGNHEFTTNANESANARIKKKVNYKANELYN